LILLTLSSLSLLANRNFYSADIYLDQATDKLLPVSLTLPEVEDKFIYYTLPLNKNLFLSGMGFDKHILKLKASDRNGNDIPFRKIDYKTIEIKNTSKEGPISLNYYVKSKEENQNNNFLAAGLILNKDVCFLLNYNVLIGYIDGYRHLPASIRVHKPEDFYGSGSMNKEVSTDSTDIFLVDTYDSLYDQPILYAQPDTSSFTSNGDEFLVSVFSSGGAYDAKKIKRMVMPVIQGVQNFIGKIPAKKYNLVFFLSKDLNYLDNRSLKYGGLMHGSSSFYVFPEMEDESDMNSIIQKSVMHELLHFISPHTLKSSMLDHTYDLDKEFSQHLWLYEGITEYFTWLILVREKLISEEVFKNIIRENIDRMSDYPKVSLTQMSKNIHLPKYAGQYNNIYKRGSIAALVLDIELRKHSKGRSGLEDIILDMYKEYSESGKSFNDNRLFGEMQERTSYDLKGYVDKYIEGKKLFKMGKHLADIGYIYDEEFIKQQPYYGTFHLEIMLGEGKVTILDASTNPIGIIDGDRILSINDQIIDASNIQYVYDKLVFPKVVEKISLRVIRNGYVVSLEGSPLVRKKTIFHYLKDDLTAPESAYFNRFCLLYKAPQDQDKSIIKN